MPSRADVMRRLAMVAALSALILMLSSCELVVEDQQADQTNRQQTSLSQSVAALPKYDVAVSGIDFDPPLRRERPLDPQKPVKLLAAIESKGTMPLSRLVVEARITSESGDFSAQDRMVLEKLAPGETKVVEFDGMAPATMLPKSPSYRIRVSVSSLESDANPVNNSREVVIRVVD